MRGKLRTKSEWHELLNYLEYYLELGFSLKKACGLSGIPYTSVRDIVTRDEKVRTCITGAQNHINAIARKNITDSIQEGNINDSKWWLERFDAPQPLYSLYNTTEQEEMKEYEDNIKQLFSEKISTLNETEKVTLYKELFSCLGK